MKPEAPQTIIGKYAELWQGGKLSTQRLVYFNPRRPFPPVIRPWFNNPLVTCSNMGGTQITHFMKVDAQIRIANRGGLFTLVTYDESSLVFNEQDIDENQEILIEEWMWFAVRSVVNLSIAVSSSENPANLIYEDPLGAT